jgi:ABC-type multidrug transport system fused ATPase/permease subunit
MSGTLRSNLDMFGEHDDAELHAALRASGLYALSDDGTASTATRFNCEGTPSPHTTGVAGSARLTLDSLIESGGANLSQGQRQIVGALKFSLSFGC